MVCLTRRENQSTYVYRGVLNINIVYNKEFDESKRCLVLIPVSHL